MVSNPQKENGYTAISNELMEALGRIRIPGEARQMLDVIIRKTYGFNKKEDKIATSQIIEATGLNYRNVYKCRRKLKEMNIITISQKGDSKILTYSIQKDYDKWIPSPKKETLSKKSHNPLQKEVKTLSQLDIHNNNKDTIQKKALVSPFLTNPAFKDIWGAWLEVRTKLRAPNTTHALQLTLNKLDKHPIETAIKMVEQSVERGWRGIFPLSETKKAGYKKP